LVLYGKGDDDDSSQTCNHPSSSARFPFKGKPATGRRIPAGLEHRSVFSTEGLRPSETFEPALRSALLAIALWTGFCSDVARAGDLYERQCNCTAIIAASDWRGTGFLVDKVRHLVFTNYHVAPDKGKLYDIFWHLHKTNGEPWTHQEYIDNKDDLREQGKAGIGYVIAQDSSKDLALLYVTDIPDWVEECPFADHRTQTHDVVHFVGHPGDRLPFRYSLGEVDYVGHHTWTYPDGQSIDADIIQFQTQSYFGFSGSAIVNNEGGLVGILSGSNVTHATAIDAREIKNLLNTVHSTNVVGIYNETENTVYFSVRNGSGEWESKELEPGSGHVFWNSDGDFTVKFDWSYDEGYQEQSYGLDGGNGITGEGGSPTPWAHKYTFRPVSGGINLFTE
jgi:S1-C subfamily serine protease